MLMKSIINYLAALVILLVVFSLKSCSNDEYNDTKPKLEPKERIIFKSTSDFLNTYANLAKMERKELNDWVEKQHISNISTRTSNDNDTLFSMLPYAFQVLFNENHELQIKDSIIWIYNNKLYYIGTKEKSYPKDIEKLPIYASSDIFPVKNEVTTRYEKLPGWSTLGLNERNGHYLHEFNIPNRNTIRYIHELLSHCVRTSYYSSQALLYVSCRLEWHKSRNKWEIASELRNITFDIHGTAGIPGSEPSGGGNIMLKRTFSRVQYNQEYLIQSFQGYVPPTANWSIYIEGLITHELSDYPNTKWSFPTSIIAPTQPQPGRIW